MKIRIRIHPLLQALVFSFLSLVGMFTPGQVGGLIAGAFGCATMLALNDWKTPDALAAWRGLKWRLFRDPRLARFPRLARLLQRP